MISLVFYIKLIAGAKCFFLNIFLSNGYCPCFQLSPYHFVPPGLLIPVTTIYDTRYGEIEEKQSELRRNLHLRLQLPLDRPLLRISNALNFSIGGTDKKASKSGMVICICC
jgi:hypothetical protein